RYHIGASMRIADRVKETTTTTGTGNLTLAGSATTFRTFNNAIGTNVLFFYAIAHQSADEWEVGEGYLSGSTTLVRVRVLASSNSGAAVSLSSGTKDVFGTLPAAEIIGKAGIAART